jgi:ATP-binding cassette subfamily F protein 3
MKSKDVLKEAIAAFDGTVIVVSHDRQFLDGLVEKVYSFAGGRVREHLGGIYDWLMKKPADPPPVLPAREGANTSANGQRIQSGEVIASSLTGKAGGGPSYAEQKAQARQRRKLEKAVAEAEAEVAQLEAALHLVEDKLATPEGAADLSLYERHSRLKAQLEEAEARWLEASEELNN